MSSRNTLHRVPALLDSLDREGKRHLLKELGVKVTVSGSEEELLITVDAVFDATRNADSED